jgi:hypothetical protein
MREPMKLNEYIRWADVNDYRNPYKTLSEEELFDVPEIEKLLPAIVDRIEWVGGNYWNPDPVVCASYCEVYRVTGKTSFGLKVTRHFAVSWSYATGGAYTGYLLRPLI